MSQAWSTSSRERLLEALRVVLLGIEGVKTVRRQPPTMNMALSDSETPAIIIDDPTVQYEWLDRHGRRIMQSSSSVVLDCHAVANYVAGREAYANVATLRETFARRVMLELANNPTLVVQLDDETEPQAHAKDVAGTFRVSNLPVDAPWVRFGIMIEPRTTDCLDTRTMSDWRTMALCIQPQDVGIHREWARTVDLELDDLVSMMLKLRPAHGLAAMYPHDSVRRLVDASNVGNGEDPTDFVDPPTNSLEFTGDVEVQMAPLYPKAGHATLFSGGAAFKDFARLDELGVMNADTSFSIVAFTLRIGDLGANQHIAGWRGPNTPYWQLFTNDTGETRFRFRTTGGAEQDIGGGGAARNTLQTHVAVIDRAADEVRVYQDGNQVATLGSLATLADTFEVSTPTDLFGVGAFAQGPLVAELPTAVVDPFEGVVQFVCVIKKALTDAEAIRIHALAGLA